MDQSISDIIKQWDGVVESKVEQKSIEELVTMDKELGRGQFGVVYKATMKVAVGQAKSGQVVVVKVQSLDQIAPKKRPKTLQNIKTEITALYRAQQHNCGDVNEIFDAIYSEKDQKLYFILEFVTGGTLEEFLQEIDVKVNFEEPLVTEMIVNPLIRGLRCLHSAGMAHRDIKPANIMIDDNVKTKWIDLGLTCVDTCPESVAGSPVYTSQEILTKASAGIYSFPLGEWKQSDVWSLGCTLFQILNNEMFGPQDRSVNSDKDNKIIFKPIKTIYEEDFANLPKEFPCLNKLVRACLQLDPQLRWEEWNRITNDSGLDCEAALVSTVSFSSAPLASPSVLSDEE